MPVEIGGLNSTIPLVAAGRLGLPVVDADGMARAFPEVQMVSFGIAGVPAAPMVLVNEHGDYALVQADDNNRVERVARSVCEAMGGVVHAASYIMSGQQARAHAIHGTLSMAIGLGAAVRTARNAGRNLLASILGYLDGTGIYDGSAQIFAARSSISTVRSAPVSTSARPKLKTMAAASPRSGFATRTCWCGRANECLPSCRI
ncbi:hypothetical protein C7I85_23140 [Mesorhizobium soli]|uniref:Uncharacterized protein n=1 Tax=Pseudaminobacter soli (ex Li et al. 2025) TaxID=1295366 RepID=A0A2P7S3T1_9HYPH|nr:hypothetical protein C7I85_23140 [Mesorhizobium soli]